MASPVGGLRAVRALRSTRSNDKNPDNTIFSPLETLPTTTSSKAFSTSATVFLLAPLSATIASTNSALFTGRLLALIESELGVPSSHRQFYRKKGKFRGYRLRIGSYYSFVSLNVLVSSNFTRAQEQYFHI